MSQYNVTVEMPNQQIYSFSCQPQNIKQKLLQKDNQIPCDNMILVDNQDDIFSAVNISHLINTQNKELKLHFKVLDAKQLYKEFKQQVNTIKKYQYDLDQNKENLKKLYQEMKDKENNYQNDLSSKEQQYNEKIRIKQEEFEQIKKQFEKDIQQASKKNIQLESDIKEIAYNHDKQENNIKKLKEINGNLEKINKELQRKIEEFNKMIQIFEQKNEEQKQKINELEKYINYVNQEKQTLQQQYQMSYDQTCQQYQMSYDQTCQQYQNYLNNMQKNYESIVQSQEQSQKDIEKQKQMLKKEEEKNKQYQDKIIQYENKITDLEAQIKQKEKQLEIKNNEINDCKQLGRSSKCYFDEASVKVSQLEKDKKNLQTQLDDINLNLITKDEECNQQIIQIQKLIIYQKEQKQKIDQLEQKVEDLEGNISQKVDEIKKKDSKLSNLNQELNDQAESNQNLKYKNLELVKQIEDLKEKLKNQNNREGQQQQVLQISKSSRIQPDRDEKEYIKKNHDLQNQLMQSKQQNQQIERDINEVKQKLKSMEQNQENYKQKVNQQEQKLHQEIILLKEQLYFTNQIIKKLSQKNMNIYQQGEVTSLMQRLMSSIYRINDYHLDPQSIISSQEYEIFEIILENDKAKQQKIKQYFFFEECLTTKKLGIVKLKRNVNINANAESTFFKGYVNQIQESTAKELQGKYLLRKELISQVEQFDNTEDILEIVKNNFLCQFLLQQFNDVLISQKMKVQEYKIARQFILKHIQKVEYYYCEMVEEGQYEKINGGTFIPNQNEIHKYFNAFSNYVLQNSKQELTITYIQLCGKYIYDMIVTSNNIGVFSPLDQGENEIIQFKGSTKGEFINSNNYYWNQKIENIANSSI
ncbi:unnamed protein product [Paramecium pentaurelia]|uniref:Alpha-type protein kinase domain-containing protein n=1 Tax=Paramecium pentaurelia TaxID=43138 RepID=A0A8S1VFW7_9CILI|nr:unnamed protein product [Paramecium pentaurelia]